MLSWTNLGNLSQNPKRHYQNFFHSGKKRPLSAARHGEGHGVGQGGRSALRYTVMGLTVHHDNFYFSDAQIEKSPSRDDGIDEVCEFRSKVYGCELIQEGSILLKATQAVACTGQVLLHRFYAKRSLIHFDVETVAATCVFLACKLEEQPRKVRDVINVFHRGKGVRNRGLNGTAGNTGTGNTSTSNNSSTDPLHPLDTQSDQYDQLKCDLIRTERHALREFGFCVQVEHPHKFVLNYLRMFECAGDKSLIQSSWAYANDSLRTDLCIRFKACQVAVACVHLANRFLKRTKMPEKNNEHWFLLFDVTEGDLNIMCESILALYVMCAPGGERARYIDVKKAEVDVKKAQGDAKITKQVKEVEAKLSYIRSLENQITEQTERRRSRSPERGQGRGRLGDRRDVSRDRHERRERSRSRDRHDRRRDETRQ
tara:strand:- start:8560 stop:9840 length:1281 start_codon:yes stop_codon:yes gene_type:complete